MATTKPRTNAKRSTASRSVRVTKKKQGVSKKQTFILVGILAVIGVVAVVASHAATAPSTTYISISDNSDSYGHSVQSLVKVASDASKKSNLSVTSIGDFLPYAVSISREKQELAAASSGTIRTYSAADLSKVSTLNMCATGTPSNSCNFNGNILSWLPGGKTIIGSNSVEIFSMTKGASSRKVLVSATPTKGGNVMCPVVQPKGSKIAYLERNRSAGDFYRIITMNADATNRVAIYRSEGRVAELGCPSWSTDGSQLSFAAMTHGDKHQVNMMAIKANGTSLRTVATLFRGSGKDLPAGQAYNDMVGSFYRNFNNSLLGQRVWSPGNTSMLVIREAGGVQNLYQLNVVTKKLTAVTSNKTKTTTIGKFSWSTDGRIIYGYGTRRPDTSEPITTVKSVNADGSSARLLYQASDKSSVDAILQ